MSKRDISGQEVLSKIHGPKETTARKRPKCDIIWRSRSPPRLTPPIARRQVARQPQQAPTMDALVEEEEEDEEEDETPI